jgi:hypothetical protein
MRGCSEAFLCHSLLDFHPPIQYHPSNKNSGAPILISKSRHQYLHVNDFKRMNNESYIRITLSNLAALLARANVLVTYY